MGLTAGAVKGFPPRVAGQGRGAILAVAKRPTVTDGVGMAKRVPSKTAGLVHLLHGEDEVAMGLARTRLVEKLVAAEMRAENVSDLAPRPNAPLRLKACLADILDDLSTASFFPEHRRVVAVQDLQEFTSKPSKESAPLIDRLLAFLRDELTEIGNAVIFTVHEDNDRRRKIQRTGKLFKAIAEIGNVQTFPTDNLTFAFQDALLARNLGECLHLIDRRLEQSRASDRLGVLRAMYADLVKFTRLLLQAKIIQRGGASDPETFPTDKRLNLQLQHPVVQRKVTGAARRFKTPVLVALRRDLQRANRHFAPSLEDIHVADQRLLLEHLLSALCAQEALTTR